MKISMTRDAADLDRRRDGACAVLDKIAETVRAKYITEGAGQAMTYLHKTEEARDALAGGTGAHPLLDAEAAATDVAIADLAATVLAMFNAWKVKGAEIEGARMGGKAAIRAAATPAAIEAAALAAQAALNAL